MLLRLSHPLSQSLFREPPGGRIVLVPIRKGPGGRIVLVHVHETWDLLGLRQETSASRVRVRIHVLKERLTTFPNRAELLKRSLLAQWY